MRSAGWAKIHPTFGPGRAKTGRWNSSKINFQQLPQGLRDLFTVEPGNWWVSGDYSGLELRCSALLTGDKPWLKAFAEGQDVHRENTKALFKLTDAQLDRMPKSQQKRLRKLQKPAVFGPLYGAGYKTVHKNILNDFPSFKLAEARELVDNLFAAHPDIKRWQEEQIRLARTQGYVEEPFSGRRKHFYGRVSPTEAVNFPNQTLASWIGGNACLRIAKRLREDEFLLAMIHDSFEAEGPDPVRLWQVLKECMEVTLEYRGNVVHFPATISVGINMGLQFEAESADEVSRLVEWGRDGVNGLYRGIGGLQAFLGYCAPAEDK